MGNHIRFTLTATNNVYMKRFNHSLQLRNALATVRKSITAYENQS